MGTETPDIAKEIASNTPSTPKDPSETLDKILQSKISDETMLNNAKSIFAKVQENFTDPIDDYVKDLNYDRLDYVVNNDSEPVKYVIEYIRTTTGMTAGEMIIDVTKQEQGVTKQEQGVTKQEKDVNEQKQDISKQNREINQREEDKAALEQVEKEKTLAAWKKTKDSYDNVKNKVTVNDENKKDIPNEVITQATTQIDAIRKALPAADISLNDYMNFYLTAHQKDFDISDPINKKFVDDYTTLNEKLYIPTVFETDGKKIMNPNTTEEVIQSNTSLSNYTKNSPKFDGIKAPVFDEKLSLDKEFDLYVKFIEDEDLREELTKKKGFIKTVNVNIEENKDLDELTKYDNYTTDIETEIDKVKATLTEKTEAILKQRVLGSCITGLAGYFDTTTINEENFAEDFDINVQKGFEITDDVLSVKGKIKDNDIGFYYDLANEDVHLQSDDFLHYDTEHNSFNLGIAGGGKSDIGVKLPTVGELSKQAQTFSTENFSKLLEEKTADDFYNNFKMQLSVGLGTNFGKKEIVQSRVERDVEKNIAIQKMQKILIPDIVMNEAQKDKKIDQNDKNMRKIMKIWDTSTENMTSSDLRTLRTIMETLPTRSTKMYKNLEPKRTKMFKEITTERNATSYGADRGKGILKFFKSFSKNNKINMTDLSLFINETLAKDETVQENMGINGAKTTFSSDFITQQDHEDADELLDGIT